MYAPTAPPARAPAPAPISADWARLRPTRAPIAAPPAAPIVAPVAVLLICYSPVKGFVVQPATKHSNTTSATIAWFDARVLISCPPPWVMGTGVWAGWTTWGHKTGATPPDA